MITLYAMDFSSMGEPMENPGIMKRLSKRRREKLTGLKLPEVRKECAAAGMLLSSLLSKHGLSEDDVTYGDNGKPECKGLYFNLSHSGNIVLCALSEEPVGCDVEKLRTGYEKLIRRIFTEKEKQYWLEAPDEEKDCIFTKIWTVKESYMKMTGEGMKIPILSMETEFADEIIFRRNGIQQECRMKEYELPGYKVTVCGSEKEFAREITWLDWKEEI